MDQQAHIGEREEIVWLDGPRGRLFAIVHWPASVAPRQTCVIMLNSGQISRVGPQRLYISAARHWAKLGFVVLRVDLAGVGDSDAENPVIHFDNHSAIEVAAAVKFAREELQVEQVVLQGLCAGARAAFKCATSTSGVDGVLSWSCPVFSAADGMPESPEASKGQMSAPRARDSVGRIGGAFTNKRFLTCAWWRNRLRYGRSELKELARAVSYFLRGKPQSTSRFLESTDAFLRKNRPALFIYGDRDRISLAEFRERFATVPENTDATHGYRVIPGATHTFSSYDSQLEVIEKSAFVPHRE
jgi:pimeloyl-ACP methyl ester carboxylesterase